MDERGDKRWFTLSSSPTEELLSITTKLAAEKASSFKQTLLKLHPGAEVNLADPMGDFVLPKDPSMPLVFIAGGIGITTYRSMIKWLIDTGEYRDIHLIYSLSTADEIVFKKLFETYDGLKLDIIFGGRLTAGGITEYIDNIKNKQVYISGPEPMVEDLDRKLKNLGLKPGQIIPDFFPGYVDI